MLKTSDFVWQAAWQPKDCGILAVRVQPCSEAGGGSAAGDCQGGGCGSDGCSDESGPHVTLAAVHCSASMGIAYCTGNRQQPAVVSGLRQEPLEQQQQQAGAGGRVHTQMCLREPQNTKPRAVYVQFLRQAVPDAAQPAICSFAASV